MREFYRYLYTEHSSSKKGENTFLCYVWEARCCSPDETIPAEWMRDVLSLTHPLVEREREREEEGESFCVSVATIPLFMQLYTTPTSGRYEKSHGRQGG